MVIHFFFCEWLDGYLLMMSTLHCEFAMTRRDREREEMPTYVGEMGQSSKLILNRWSV